VKRNVQKLVEVTNAIQENCGISSRLLWSESGENLAHKLIARLQRVN
jgi:ferric iron reductase protein FhuF